MHSLKILFYFLAFYAVIAESTTVSSNCFPLRFLAGEGQNDEEVTLHAYNQVLENFRPVFLKNNVWETMVKSGNPFVLPENAVEESATARNTLLEMQVLVEEHFKEGEKIKALLINRLKGMAKGTEKQEARQTKVDVAHGSKPFETVAWKEPMHSTFAKGDWVFGVSAKAGSPAEFRFSRSNGEKLSLPCGTEEPSEVSTFDPATGTLYYFKKNSGPALYKATLFQENGNPVEKFSPEAVQITGPSNKVSEKLLLISPDGKQLLFQTDAGVTVGKIGAKAVKFVNGKNQFSNKGPQRFLQWVGNDHIARKSDDFVLVKNLKNGSNLHLSSNYALGSVASSPDGRFLYLTHYRVGLKPELQTWDLQKLAKDENTKPHALPLKDQLVPTAFDTNSDFVSPVFPTPNPKYLIQLTQPMMNGQEKRSVVLRDATDFKELYHYDLSLPYELINPRLTPDGKKLIFDYRNSEFSFLPGDSTTYVVDIEAFIAIAI